MRELTVSLAIQDLRRQILGSSAKRVCHIRILHIQLAQSEITEGNMSGIIKKDILRFQVPEGARVSFVVKMKQTFRIPVYNVEIVKVFQSQ